MRHATMIILAAVALVVSPLSAQESQPAATLAQSVDLHIVVSDRDADSRALAGWADSMGGYFTLRCEELVQLRIPPALIPELRALVEERGALIVSYNPSAMDYREELARNGAAIQSRTESLERILEYLEDSGVAATLSFEREMRGLLQEIEYYTGRNRRIRNDIAYANVSVTLSSRRRTIPEQRPSSFPWVNTVDLYRFLREAQP